MYDYRECATMSIRVQVILNEKEAAQFKAQARKESKSLSSWLRDAGRSVLDLKKSENSLKDPTSLRIFFEECETREKGVEPDWEEQKQLILEGYQEGSR
jgi:hypothetical protein